MQYKNAAILVAGLAAQQIVATGWTDAGSYSCPGNTNNHCSGSQQGGYNWGGLPSGSFNQYGSNSFSGFSYSSSFGKRDLLSERGFQSKCITGNLDDSPSMSCNGDDTMSIDTMQVSSSQDTDIDCHYDMPDGSTCTETHSCSSGGSVFQNTQCGGAKAVTFKPGSNAPAGCTIGVHSVGFNCGSASSTVPASTPTPYTSASVSVASYSTSSVVSSPLTSSTPVVSISSCGYGESCSTESSTPIISISSCGYGESCSTSSVFSSSSAVVTSPVTSSTPVISITSCGYGEKCSESTSASSTSAVVTSPLTSSTSVVSISTCGYGENCGSVSSAVASSSSQGIPGYGGSTSSAVVSSPVSSSTVSICYGKSCGGSPSTVSSAVASSSSQGIPGYGGSTSSPVVSPVSSSPISSSSQGIPGYGGSTSSPIVSPVSSTTLSVCHGKHCGSSPSTVTVATISNCGYGEDCSSSSTTVSVATISGCAYGEDCGSVSSAAPTASSQGIPGYGGSTSSAVASPVSSSPVSSYITSTIYSTTVDTITSCGPEVTNCPARSTTVRTKSIAISTTVRHVTKATVTGGYGASSSISAVSVSYVSSSPVGPVSSSASLTTTATSYPTPNCPGLLPRCLNTWMYMTGCKDNSDADCFCGNEQFIKNVMGCISAWSESESDTQAAASYLMGLCAAHVPTNPAIITACPSTVTPAPTPAGYTSTAVSAVSSGPAVSSVIVESSTPASPVTTTASEECSEYKDGQPQCGGATQVSTVATTPVSPATTAPCTTITYSSSVVVPVTYSSGVSAGLTIASSYYTTNLVTTVTVPQVQITTSVVTSAGHTSTSVGLGAGAPSSVPAYPTPASTPVGPVGGAPSSAVAGATGYGTTFGTSWGATPSASSSPIVPATGAGAKVRSSLAGMALAAVAILAAL